MGATFEELCRAHIEAFAKGAEKFALNTKLTERVSQWQARLAPILEAEERKAAFDIQYYSEILLESSLEKLHQLQETKQIGVDDQLWNGTTMKKRQHNLFNTKDPVPVDFGSVTLGCTQSDVCRFFLASLSLANSGNLEILIDDVDDVDEDRYDVGGISISTTTKNDTVDQYRFKIISDDIHKPMETYRAPSLV
jgi:condensin-2 complex subunit H2